MKFHYDKQADALAIRFQEGKYAESDEVSEGVIFDYDGNGRILGIEVLDASKRFPKKFNQQFSRKRLPVVFDVKEEALA